MLKKIIIFCIIFFVCTPLFLCKANNSWSIIADQDQVEIILEVSSSKVQINNLFDFIVYVKNKWQNNNVSISEPKIIWIENFEVRWTSNSQSITMLNNYIESNSKFIFNVFASKDGNFTIWPAEIDIWWNVIKSNTVNLQVVLPNVSFNENKNLNKDTSTFWNSNVNNNVNNKGNTNFSLNEILFIFWAILLFTLIIFYFYLKNFEKKENSNTFVVKNKNNNELKINLDIFDNNLEKKCLHIVKKYFEQKYWIIRDNLTFEELISFEKDQHKKVIIENIFNLLSEKLYADREIDKNKLIELIKQLI